jgi:hypothetical protein
MKKSFLLFILFFSCYVYSFSSTTENAIDINVEPATGYAKSIGTWEVSIIVKEEITRGSTIKLCFVKGMLRELNTIPSSADYCKKFIDISVSNSSVIINMTDFQSTIDENLPFWEKDVHNRIITMKIAEASASLLPGDTIKLIINKQLSTKVRAHETAAKDNIKVCIAERNSTLFIPMKSEFAFEIFPLFATQIFSYVKSVAKPGEPILLQTISNDIYNNLSRDYTGTITYSSVPPVAGFPIEVKINPGDSGRKEQLISFPDTGVYYLEGVASNNIPVFKSNPIWVTSVDYNVFWGDIHSHGTESRDGIGINKFDYAKFTRGLDFFTPTDHCDHGKQVSGISDEEWSKMKADVLRLNENGRFVPFLGYENSYNSAAGGHYNIYFNFDDDKINDLPLWPRSLYPDILSIWNVADSLSPDYEVITIPHHCGKIFNVNLINDPGSLNNFGGKYFNPKYKPAIEMFSTHGLSESYDPSHNLSYENKSALSGSANGPHYAQDAWVIGEKLGVVAGSDDHIAHPGVSSNGLTAVVSKGILNRNNIFSAIKNRSTYATTGERIIVYFQFNDSISMGNSSQENPKYIPKMDIKVMGTDELDYVELLKWDTASGQILNNHPNFEIVKKWTFQNGERNFNTFFQDPYIIGNSIYYDRVKQKNIISNREVWAWTSPIWIEKEVDTMPVLDSIINFKASNEKIFQSDLYWEILNQKEFVKYSILKVDNNPIEVLVGSINATIPNNNKNVYQLTDELLNDGINVYQLFGYKAVGSVGKYLSSDSVFAVFDSLQFFSALLNDEKNEIEFNWDLKNEYKVVDYLIETSSDSINFNTIKFVAPLLKKQIKTSYKTLIPFENKAFARLTILLQSGEKKSFYAKFPVTTSILNKSNVIAGLSLKSNLLANNHKVLELICTNKKPFNGSVLIYDASGKTVSEPTIYNFSSGSFQSINVNALTPGIYFIECTSGELKSVFKFVISSK